MERIRIDKTETLYEITNIRQVSTHVLQIVFTRDVPGSFGDIYVFTWGGVQCSYLPGYKTIWKQDGETVWLSDDGSVYTPPVDPEPITPVTPTLEEVKASKISEVNAACQQKIYAGTDVQLTDGTTEHFSLTEDDQANLTSLQLAVASGQTQVPYHTDGQPCCFYSVADFQLIFAALMKYKVFQTTYCNSLHTWISACTTADEVTAITYGADIPEAYQSDVLKAYLAAAA